MAEDAKVVTEEVVKDANTEALGTEEAKGAKEDAAPAELSATEQLAKSQGWVPLDEWQGDPRDHRSAKEFVDRGELLGKIRSQSQELQAVKNIATQLSEQNKKVYQAGYENALKELKAAKVTAIENQDGKALVAIEEKIDDTKDKLAALNATKPAATVPTGPSPDYQLYLQRNPQYLQSASYRVWSHNVAKEFAQRNPHASEGDVYAFIEEEQQREWPDRYNPSGKAQRRAPPSPDGEGRGTANKGSGKGSSAGFDALIASMPEDQAKVAKDMVKRGFITKDKYVEDYNSIGGN